MACVGSARPVCPCVAVVATAAAAATSGEAAAAPSACKTTSAARASGPCVTVNTFDGPISGGIFCTGAGSSVTVMGANGQRLSIGGKRSCGVTNTSDGPVIALGGDTLPNRVTINGTRYSPYALRDKTVLVPEGMRLCWCSAAAGARPEEIPLAQKQYIFADHNARLELHSITVGGSCEVKIGHRVNLSPIHINIAVGDTASLTILPEDAVAASVSAMARALAATAVPAPAPASAASVAPAPAHAAQAAAAPASACQRLSEKSHSVDSVTVITTGSGKLTCTMEINSLQVNCYDNSSFDMSKVLKSCSVVTTSARVPCSWVDIADGCKINIDGNCAIRCAKNED